MYLSCIAEVIISLFCLCNLSPRSVYLLKVDSWLIPSWLIIWYWFRPLSSIKDAAVWRRRWPLKWMLWPECYLLLNSQMSSHVFICFPPCPPWFLIYFSIKLSNISLFLTVFPAIPQIIPQVPPISLIVLHVIPSFFLISHCSPCRSWWWSWLNLSDDVLPCYHLLADDVFCLFCFFDLIIMVDCWLFLS